MAGHQSTKIAHDDDTPPQVDIDAHQLTFDTFMNLTKWAIGVVVLILIGMAVFLL